MAGWPRRFVGRLGGGTAMKRTGRIGLLLALVVVAAGCGTSINSILTNPARYRNESVTVSGTVDQSVSVAGRGAYRITDGDQGLWVVTTTGAPRKGARVRVTGRVQDGFDLSAFGNVLRLPGSAQSGLVLVESSHSARD
jgi:hypothetical protein